MVHGHVGGGFVNTTGWMAGCNLVRPNDPKRVVEWTDDNDEVKNRVIMRRLVVATI